MKEFDINESVACFAAKNINSVLGTGAGFLRLAADKARLKLTRTYSIYLENACKNHSYVKSFFFRAEPTFLYNFYVPTSLRYSKGVIEKPDIQVLDQISKKIIISGLAGGGKSMLMRHLFLSSISEKHKVPIFVELRKCSDSKFNLMELVCASLKENRFQLDVEYVEKALCEGHFSIFLDGFDEIAQSNKREATRQIQEFAHKYENNNLFVSSRQDHELEGWREFVLMQIEPLSLELAEQLIEKIDYQEELKKKFIKELRERLFSKHSSMLSNPLLLTIMLLTYGQNADIPEKLNIFYNQAYEALFDRHDALKSGYRRNHYTSLDIQDFAKVFSAFSMVSYDKRKFMFSQLEALDFISTAQGIVGIKCDRNCYLKDTLQSVCLLAEDGLNIVFTHRSFQEYFVARFISEAPLKIQKKLIYRYAENMDRDNVFFLLHELRPELVEQEFLAPELRKMFRTLGIKRKVMPSGHLKYLTANFSSISISADHLSAVIKDKGKNKFYRLASAALRLCGKLVRPEEEDLFAGNMKCLRKKYGVDVEFNLGAISPSSEFYKDIAKYGGFLSLPFLQRVFDVQSAINHSKKQKTESLEDVLGKGVRS